MKKNISFFTFLMVGLLSLNACKKAADSGIGLTAEEKLITAHTWKAEGLYVNDQKTSSPDLELKFNTTLAGAFKTLSVGGFPTPSTWALDADGKRLTIVYPKDQSFSGFSSITLNISTLTETQLNFRSDNETSLYDIVNLNAESELRMNPKE